MESDDAARVRIIYERLQSLRTQVSNTKPENSDTKGRPGSGLSVLANGFNDLLESTQRLVAGDRLVADTLFEISPITGFEEGQAAQYHMTVKQQLIFSIEAILHALGQRLLSASGAPTNISIEREGLFVTGQRFDALLAATRIIATARADIILVDGYISDRVLNLMTAKTEAATVRILTKAPLRPAIVTLSTAFNDQYGHRGALAIRTSDMFHDRFLVLLCQES
jgi:hypothetical protein